MCLQLVLSWWWKTKLPVAPRRQKTELPVAPWRQKIQKIELPVAPWRQKTELPVAPWRQKIELPVAPWRWKSELQVASQRRKTKLLVLPQRQRKKTSQSNEYHTFISSSLSSGQYPALGTWIFSVSWVNRVLQQKGMRDYLIYFRQSAISLYRNKGIFTGNYRTSKFWAVYKSCQ